MIEIFDAVTTPSYASPGRIYLSWYPDTGAEYYLIEEAPEGIYTEIARVTESGLGYYRYLTKWLSDGYSGTWRITPVDAAGNSGDPLLFKVAQVRHPDVPNVEYSYSDTTGKVTINRVGDEGIYDMADEWVIETATGSGALAFTVASSAAKRLKEVRLKITDGATNVTGFQVLVGPAGALTDDVLLYSPNTTDGTSAENVVYLPGQPQYVEASQDIDCSWTNSGGSTWELQVVYQLI
jgi:hypothetical protein